MKKAMLISLMIATHLLSSFGQDVTGYYRSNFAIAGWFATQMQLNPDSTFFYEYAGDLDHDWATGKYFLKQNTIILMYDTAILERNYEDTYLINAPRNLAMLGLRNSYESIRPSKLQAKGNKLFIITMKGELIKRKDDHRLKSRKYFLEKLENVKWTWWNDPPDWSH